jgi:hypothetical protein
MKFNIEAELTGVPHKNGLAITQNLSENRHFTALGTT